VTSTILPSRDRSSAPPPAIEDARPVRDVVSFLTVFLCTMLLIPAALGIGPLGTTGSPASMVGLLCLLWWIAALVLPDSGLARGFHPVRLAIGMFVIAWLVSYILIFTRFVGGDEVRAADRGLILLASFSGVALLTADGVSTWDRLDTLLRRFSNITAGLAGLGVVQFFTGLDINSMYRIPGLQVNSPLNNIAERSDLRRVVGLASHPIEYGVLMAVAFPFALHYASIETDEKKRRWRWVAVALVGAAVAMSVSRSGILGVIFGGGLMLTGWSGRRRINGIAGALAFLAFMRVLIPGMVGTLLSLFTNVKSDSSYQARQERYPAAFKLIHQHWIFGRGPGTLLPQNFYAVVPLDNQYLASAIEIGVVGLTAMIAMMLIGIFTARGARRRSTDPGRRDLANAVAAAILVCFVSFYTFDALGYPLVVSSLALMLGAAGAMWRITRAEDLERRRIGAAVGGTIRPD
jgi:polysaccharide biosynthesis protein PslJ